jgi:hypothetical protein
MERTGRLSRSRESASASAGALDVGRSVESHGMKHRRVAPTSPPLKRKRAWPCDGLSWGPVARGRAAADADSARFSGA